MAPFGSRARCLFMSLYLHVYILCEFLFPNLHETLWCFFYLPTSLYTGMRRHSLPFEQLFFKCAHLKVAYVSWAAHGCRFGGLSQYVVYSGRLVIVQTKPSAGNDDPEF